MAYVMFRGKDGRLYTGVHRDCESKEESITTETECAETKKSVSSIINKLNEEERQDG